VWEKGTSHLGAGVQRRGKNLKRPGDLDPPSKETPASGGGDRLGGGQGEVEKKDPAASKEGSVAAPAGAARLQGKKQGLRNGIHTVGGISPISSEKGGECMLRAVNYPEKG